MCHDDSSSLRAVWSNLTADPNPEMMVAFEEVLAKLTGDLQRKSAERQDLETTLKIRNKTQEEHLQHLYEEMEQQIQRERKSIREEEEVKAQRTRKGLETRLEMKDAQLNNLLEKQKLLQQQLDSVKGQGTRDRMENIELIREKIHLEKEVESQRIHMRDLQVQLAIFATKIGILIFCCWQVPWERGWEFYQ